MRILILLFVQQVLDWGYSLVKYFMSGWVNLVKLCKVKCTLLQALRLCTGRTAHRRIRGIALLFHDHGTRRGWGVSVTPWPLFTTGKEPVPIVQEAGWAPGPIWTGAENLAPTGIRSPDRPTLSQSLYQLRYPAHGICFFVCLLILYFLWNSLCMILSIPLVYNLWQIS